MNFGHFIRKGLAAQRAADELIHGTPAGMHDTQRTIERKLRPKIQKLLCELKEKSTHERP